MKLSVFLLVLMTATALANDTRHAAKDQQLIDDVFWSQLYTGKYHTLYCAVNKQRDKQSGNQVSVTQVYPAQWLAVKNGCGAQSKKGSNCAQDMYKRANTDLHNLWPALPRYKNSRGMLPFIEIPGEVMYFPRDKCDFEQVSTNTNQDKNQNISQGNNQGVEPRDYAKGEIARAILYMLWKYQLPDHGMLPLMVKWANNYPVSTEEKWRNDKIKRLQGNTNPFIDNEDMPSLYLSIR